MRSRLANSARVTIEALVLIAVEETATAEERGEVAPVVEEAEEGSVAPTDDFSEINPLLLPPSDVAGVAGTGAPSPVVESSEERGSDAIPSEIACRHSGRQRNPIVG